MSRWMMLLSAFCLTVAACERPPTDSSDAQAPRTHSVQQANLVIGDPIRCKNLTVFPVCSKEPKNQDRFITLEEGLEDGTVEIFEVGAAPGSDEQSPPNADPRQAAANEPPQEVSGDVNRLMALNTSGRPLYLMPGEIIIGGKQDRCIRREMIVPSGEEPFVIDVYCVEHGRWSGRGGRETAALLADVGDLSDVVMDEAALNQMAAAADRGRFVGKAGYLSKRSRLAAQSGKAQHEIWDEVGQANAAAHVQTDSGSFTANYADPDVQDRLREYVDAVRAPVEEEERVIGVIVATNGKIESVDVFESTPLFRKLWPKLLASYALDAANAADSPDADKRATPADADDFLAAAMQGNADRKTENVGGLLVTRHSTDGVASFSALEAADASADESSAMGGFGGGVHSAAFAED